MVCIGQLKLYTENLDETSGRDEMVRDTRRVAETFWVETETRPRRPCPRYRRDRDVEHFSRDETKMRLSTSRDGLETESSRPRPHPCNKDNNYYDAVIVAVIARVQPVVSSCSCDECRASSVQWPLYMPCIGLLIPACHCIVIAVYYFTHPEKEMIKWASMCFLLFFQRCFQNSSSFQKFS